jgi:hypothetical protein
MSRVLPLSLTSMRMVALPEPFVVTFARRATPSVPSGAASPSASSSSVSVVRAAVVRAAVVRPATDQAGASKQERKSDSNSSVRTLRGMRAARSTLAGPSISVPAAASIIRFSSSLCCLKCAILPPATAAAAEPDELEVARTRGPHSSSSSSTSSSSSSMLSSPCDNDASLIGRDVYAWEVVGVA